MNTLLDLPDDARAWVYPLSREIGAADAPPVRDILDEFLAEWNSHGAPVRGAWALLENRFLAIAGHCPAGIGGCSTDSSVHAVRRVEQAVNVSAFDRALVFFRDHDGTVCATSRDRFQRLVDSGDITPDTQVFDTTITSVGDLRAGNFERPFSSSWHARAFPRRAQTPPA